MTAMLHATVEVAGARQVLLPGAVIGRGRAGLRISHPAVSEAHALCSLREDGLVLLPLRGTLSVHGQRVPRVLLYPGTVVELAEDVHLRVLDLHAREHELALRVGDDDLPLPLGYGVLSAGARWVDRPRDPSDLEVWLAGAEHLARQGAGTPKTLAAGDHFRVGGQLIEVVEVAKRTTTPTQRLLDLYVAPSSAEIRRHGRVLHAFPEVQTELLVALCQLSPADQPVGRADLMRGIWGQKFRGKDNHYDNLVKRLRGSVRAAGLPAVLARPRRGALAIDRANYDVRFSAD